MRNLLRIENENINKTIDEMLNGPSLERLIHIMKFIIPSMFYSNQHLNMVIDE